MVSMSGAGPVCLVDLVYLVSFIQPNNQINQIDLMNKTAGGFFQHSAGA